MLRSPLLPTGALALRQTFDRALNESLTGGPFQTLWSRMGSESPVAQVMPIDVYATDDHAMVLAAVPGMKPEDLEVTVHQNTVSLSGTISKLVDTEQAKDITWYVHEVGSGTYRRSVTLPFPIDAEQVQASFEDGIVRVILPRAERARPRRIAIHSRQPEAIGAGATDETEAS